MNDARHSSLLAAGALIERELGLHFAPERWADLQRVLKAAAHESGEQEVERFIALLLREPEIVHHPGTVAALTIGETYFYRDPALFAALSTTFLPEWSLRAAGAGAPLRAWSAGCCTGEEAYTLAIELRRGSGWIGSAGFELIATDLNVDFLRVAAAGIYRAWSFRDAPAWLRPTYCEPLGDDRYAVRADIRSRVRFAPLNLARDLYPAAGNGTENLDLILCRNVLMYFSVAQRAAAIDRLARALRTGGWLVTSAAEASHLSHPLLAPRCLGEVTVFERRASAAPSSPLIAHAAAITDDPELILGVRAMRASAASALKRETTADLLARARADASHGDLSGALRHCERALARDRFQLGAHLLRATLLEEAGRTREAEAALRSALYLDHSSIAAHFQLSALARRTGRERTAQRHAKVARELAARLPADAIVPDTEELTASQFLALTARSARVSVA